MSKKYSGGFYATMASQIMLTVNEMYKISAGRPCWQKYHRGHLGMCRGVQSFRFQEEGDLPACSCWSHDLYQNDWSVTQLEIWTDQYFTNTHPSLSVRSNRPAVIDETWDDKWGRQMFRTAGNHTESNQQVFVVTIAEPAQTGTSDRRERLHAPV